MKVFIQNGQGGRPEIARVEVTQKLFSDADWFVMDAMKAAVVSARSLAIDHVGRSRILRESASAKLPVNLYAAVEILDSQKQERKAIETDIRNAATRRDDYEELYDRMVYTSSAMHGEDTLVFEGREASAVYEAVVFGIGRIAQDRDGRRVEDLMRNIQYEPVLTPAQ